MSPDVAASIKARLLNLAKAHGEEFERTLTRFAAERLLFRLGKSAAYDRCILKGASLLAVWLPDPYRTTRDVDVLASGPTDDAAIRSMIAEICAVACPEDGLRFDLSELVVEVNRRDEEYSGKRARFHAYLGSARMRMQLDLGIGDALAAPPQEIDYPTLLEMLPAPRLRAYPRETTVAEKFEAMVKLDTANSRMRERAVGISCRRERLAQRSDSTSCGRNLGSLPGTQRRAALPDRKAPLQLLGHR